MVRKLNQTTIAPRLLSVKEACSYMGIGKNALCNLDEAKGISTKIGRRRLYDRFALDKLIEAGQGGVILEEPGEIKGKEA